MTTAPTAPSNRARRMALPAAFFALMCGTAAHTQPVTLQGSQPATPTAVGRIQGMAFDSLLMKPIARATVMLMGTGLTETTDDRGRFTFDQVPVGQRTVALSMPVFDSLGLGTLGTEATVREKENAHVLVATPSLRTLWGYRCNATNVLGTDSSLVWGTIRDVADDSLLTGAAATFRWYDLRAGRALGLQIDEVQRETLSDSTGLYFACGLPHDIVISTEAVGVDAASGRLEYAVGERRVRRIDLVIARDMVIPDTVTLLTQEDSLRANRARGHSVVRGKILDKKGKPLANAIVALANVDTTVRSGPDGQFQLSGLPAGTHALTARRVGSAPSQMFVNLRPDVTTEATLVMSDVNTLATVNVRAQKVKGRDRLDYELRRKQGFGYAMDEKDIAKRADLYSALFNLPGMRVERSGFGVTIRMNQIGFGGYACSPAVFLDGLPVPQEMATSMPTDNYRAIEVYPRAGLVPAEFYQPGGCGAVLLWSKRAAW